MENWRFWAIGILLLLSMLDLGLTSYYVSKYKSWQPDKPYNLIENNPLLVFLWNNVGLVLGMIVGAIIIWTLLFVVGKSAHPIVVGLLFLFLCYAMYTHIININLIHALIEKYPSGYLPVETFGEVIGNNLQK